MFWHVLYERHLTQKIIHIVCLLFELSKNCDHSTAIRKCSNLIAASGEHGGGTSILSFSLLWLTPSEMNNFWK